MRVYTVLPFASLFLLLGLAHAEPAKQRLTSELVATRAAKTSFAARAQDEALRAAAARVDESWSNVVPKITLKASYTRLSNLTNPAFGTGSVFTPDPPLTVNPRVIAAPAVSFPVVLDNYALQAQIVVPISDYFFRINEAVTAVTRARDAAREDAIAARAKSASEGKLAFYAHVRARGALSVAELALADAKAHLADAEALLRAGTASQADVLRAQTAVSAAELQLVRVKNLVALTEKQIRIALHAKDSEVFEIGEELEAPLPPVKGTTSELIAEARKGRPEIRSMEINLEVLRARARGTRAGALPQIAGVGETTYANPNQRRFPQEEKWFPTWSLGVAVTWSPNDIIGGLGGAAANDHQTEALASQMVTASEGIELEVVQARQGIDESDAAIAASGKQRDSAAEALRVARELFRAGRATSILVSDSETELNRARMEYVNAHVDAWVARVKLEHALGRDTRLVPPPSE